MRVYYRSGEHPIAKSPFRSSPPIREQVARLFVLGFHPKSGKHQEFSLGWVIGSGFPPGWEPVSFGSPQHEQEFLDYHPDLSGLRKRWHFGRICPCAIQGKDFAELPFRFHRGRWIWK